MDRRLWALCGVYSLLTERWVCRISLGWWKPSVVRSGCTLTTRCASANPNGGGFDGVSAVLKVDVDVLVMPYSELAQHTLDH